MKVTREPAAKRPAHPATELPTRDQVVSPDPGTAEPAAATPRAEEAPAVDATPSPAAAPRPTHLPPAPADDGEKFSAAVATRVRPSTEQRVARALDNLPRSWSKQAFHDQALNEFIDRYGLDPQ